MNGHQVTRLGKICGAFVIATMFATLPARAQAPVIPGVIGKIALKGNVDKIYSGVNIAIVKTADGLSHVVHMTGRHDFDSLDRLEPGTSVLVYGLKQDEATVMRVNPFRKRLILGFGDGTTVTLRLASPQND